MTAMPVGAQTVIVATAKDLRAQGRRRGALGAVLLGLLLFGCLGVGVSSAFAVEVPVTGVPSGVGGTVATFGGVVNPGVGVEGVAYRFAYSAG